jgi:L-asparaginase
VLVVFAGRIFPAAGVRKGHTIRLDAFANPDYGTAGSVSGAGDIRLQDGRSGIEALPLPDIGAGSPRVDLVAVHPGADSTLLRASLGAGADGVVLQGTGTGNANKEICAVVADAVASGVVVITSTRVDAGPVVPLYGDGGGADLHAAGAIPSGALRPSQSLILLSLLLRLGTPKDRIAGIFARHGKPL